MNRLCALALALALGVLLILPGLPARADDPQPGDDSPRLGPVPDGQAQGQARDRHLPSRREVQSPGTELHRLADLRDV